MLSNTNDKKGKMRIGKDQRLSNTTIKKKDNFQDYSDLMNLFWQKSLEGERKAMGHWQRYHQPGNYCGASIAGGVWSSGSQISWRLKRKKV